MLTTLYLVRHGEAAADWDNAADPGLSAKGWQQARRVADTLRHQEPMALIASPLARTRETSQPLAEHWGVEAHIDSRFAEIPSDGLALEERGQWLRQLFHQRWEQQSTQLRQWRQTAVEGLCALPQDTVIFTHFVLINAVVSAIREQDEVLQFLPDNGSITRLQRRDDRLEVVSLGEENLSLVN
ncbi:histidine phosphatase family protein [Exilibacterium tricleocarpae]|uniref:Histidine phosphatase family protein n=1 Tax=Exilibacterium tricleocarpae TaxID=2591008 RepID=A0A545U6Z6_9GAMM|nr:histidine phosphatase family protein [Exilibacterium tricleocarpae]TQV85261.1 histidine phosphatase family protein [Exilibacterium tricleocarpae]